MNQKKEDGGVEDEKNSAKKKKKKQEEETVAPHWLIRIKNIQRGKKKTRKKAQPLFFYSF